MTTLSQLTPSFYALKKTFHSRSLSETARGARAGRRQVAVAIATAAALLVCRGLCPVCVCAFGKAKGGRG